MSVEPIGLLTLAIGLICLLGGYQITFAACLVASVMGASAAFLIGSANIPPAHLLLAFASVAVFSRRKESAAALQSIKFPQPGFWFVCLLAYGLLTGIFMPRLMAGLTPIVPLGTSEYAETGTTVPLGPVSSNFTQGVYMVADVIFFMMTAGVASTRAGFQTIVSALLAYAGANIFFAFLDVATYSTGTQAALEFIRNAKYTLHIEEEISGLKRIVGSFVEASAFARSTLGALGFSGTLWVCGYRPRLTGFLAFTSLVLVVLSTSSTGLAATPPLLALIYSTAFFRNGFDAKRPWASALLLCVPLTAIALALAVSLDDGASEKVAGYLDTLIFNKASSDSGVERSSWNRYAMQNFYDSLGFGVGLGTVRTSSFPVALLACVGIPGTVFYLMFLATMFIPRRGKPNTFPTDVRVACRNACLGLIIGDFFAAPTIEQGLLFAVLAGLACAQPELARERVTALPRGVAGFRQ